MFALASLHISDQVEREHHLKIGADITNTCHESYIRTGKYLSFLAYVVVTCLHT